MKDRVLCVEYEKLKVCSAFSEIVREDETFLVVKFIQFRNSPLSSTSFTQSNRCTILALYIDLHCLFVIKFSTPSKSMHKRTNKLIRS